MTFDIGDIVVIRFPFTNHEATKQRPAVVISSTAYNQHRPDVILLAVTSQIRTPLAFGEALIKDWQQAGLLKPSVFKPMIFTVEQSMIRKALGRLNDDDQRRLQQLVNEILQ